MVESFISLVRLIRPWSDGGGVVSTLLLRCYDHRRLLILIGDIVKGFQVHAVQTVRQRIPID